MNAANNIIYDAETGEFFAPDGSPIDLRLDWCGYRRITFEKSYRLAHRLAWRLYYGYWPVDVIDHINGNILDNRISNLRECGKSQNQWNRRPNTGNPMKGVSKSSKGERYRARAKLNGKKIHLGTFDTAEEAFNAYKEFSIKTHGEYSWFRNPSPALTNPDDDLP